MLKSKKVLLITGVIISIAGAGCQKQMVPTGPETTNTLTPTPTFTSTPADTFTCSVTPTWTWTQDSSPSATATEDMSPTAQVTNTSTQTSTLTPTLTSSLTSTLIPTDTYTPVFSYTMTPTYTMSASPTLSTSHTPSLTATEGTSTPLSTDTVTITRTPSITSTQQATMTITPTATPVYLGSAVMSPTRVYSETTGNEITITYTAGDIMWASWPNHGTLRIKIPSGWSPPSMDPVAPGYFSVSVSGGSLLGKSVDGTDIVVTVRNLLPLTGQITVIYGDTSFGPGAYVEGGGLVIIPVEIDENSGDGVSTQEISSSPELDIVPATPTPVVGEGAMVINPVVVTDGTSGNTIEFTYTAGSTTWTASPAYGTLEIQLPAGWSQPSVTISDPGYFYVTTTAVGLWIGTAGDGQNIKVNISDLQPGETVTIYYGYTAFGGPGADISGAGIYTLTTLTDVDGTDVYEIADSPEISVLPPSPTVTKTYTITQTSTITPTVTKTWTETETFTITETHTITPTWTISETSTITATITQTLTYTVSPTSTVTPTFTSTPTPFWDIVGIKGFSEGEADYVSLFVADSVPYVAYMDWAYTNRMSVMKYSGASWEYVGGSPGFTAGIAYENAIFVTGPVPYVVYRDFDRANRLTAMKYNQLLPGWEYIDSVSDAGFTSGTAYSPSLYVYGDEPYVAFRDSARSGKATVMRNRLLGGWEDLGVPGFSASTASSISLHIDSGGVPYVAYRDWANSYRLTVKKYSGGSWQTVGTQGFSDGGVEYVKIFLYNTTPYVAYMDVANGNRATVKMFNGSTWQDVGNAGFTPGTAEYVSLYVYNGFPSVAFRDGASGGRAVVMKFNGAAWGLIGYISDAGARYTSLFVDEAEGKPYLAFKDENQGDGEVTVMKYEGTY